MIFVDRASYYSEAVETESRNAFTQIVLPEECEAWLHRLMSEGQLLADLAFADIVIWAPTHSGPLISVAHLRPSSAPTLFYRDLVELEIRPEWRALALEAIHSGEIRYSRRVDDGNEFLAPITAVPVRIGGSSAGRALDNKAFAVLTRHSNFGESRVPSRQELVFRECANDLCNMVCEGSFPAPEIPTAPTHWAPRASDGLIRLDSAGRVGFASPNAFSAFRRLGFHEELEGTVFSEIFTPLAMGSQHVDESLPVVLSGSAPWRTDIEANGFTVALRAIPLKRGGKRFGAVILARDITRLRSQERELITKDATIREIHHRVKNNLQTVASLLRIQSRRTNEASVKDALGQAMRRIASIAAVHETLSQGLSQTVDFDAVFERVLLLVVEVASSHGQVVTPRLDGSFGRLRSEFATPLALVLAELVTNSVEHGLKITRNGEVKIRARRADQFLIVSVTDNGSGLPMGQPGDGLGTQLVKTLVEGELAGKIHWKSIEAMGTEVTLLVPLRFIENKFSGDIVLEH